MDLKEFWEKKWAETTAVKLRRMKRKHLLMYYDYFAQARHAIHHHENEERAVLERMDSIQRVLDRKSQFWATFWGLVAAIATAASAVVGIATYLDHTRPATPAPLVASHTPATSAIPQITPTTSPSPTQGPQARDTNTALPKSPVLLPSPTKPPSS